MDKHRKRVVGGMVGEGMAVAGMADDVMVAVEPVLVL
jgi:hypothetical protein